MMSPIVQRAAANGFAYQSNSRPAPSACEFACHGERLPRGAPEARFVLQEGHVEDVSQAVAYDIGIGEFGLMIETFDAQFQHARVKQAWPEGRPFRILSIDGGGIRRVLAAAYLAEIERRFLDGRSIGSCFDMIAGTSTGGVIALALARGMTAADALRIYVERGERIFPPLSGLRKLVGFGAGSHSPSTIRQR